MMSKVSSLLPLCLFSLCMVVGLSAMENISLRGRSEENELSEDNTAIRSLSSNEKRPVMHTFYARIDPDQYVKYTGMSDEADRKMLQHWKNYWHRAGWDTKVLTLDDAKKHPDYDKFDKALDLNIMPFGYYDKLCFMRWIAVAASGGGWMADYDTFPIRKVHFDDLPADGKLAVYDQTLHGGIPCLVSGTSEEFTRVANLILDNTIERGVNEPFWSDMMALFDIHRNDPAVFVQKQGILRGEKAFEGDRHFPNPEKDCPKMAKHHWAVHFSHNAIQQGVAKGTLSKMTFDNRPNVAEGWLNQWAVRCQFFYDNVLCLTPEKTDE